jgi:hypothetical protein
VQVLSTGSESVSAVGFSADGWFVYAGTVKGRVIRLLADGTVTDLKHGMAAGTIHSICPLDSGDLYATGHHRILIFAHTAPDELQSAIQPGGPSEQFLAYAAITDSIHAAATGNPLTNAPGYLRLLDRKANKQLGSKVAVRGAARTLTAHRHRKLIAWASGDRQIVAWDISKPDFHAMNFAKPSPALAFSTDGERIAAAIDWNYMVLDWQRKREMGTYRGHKGRITALAYAPDNTLFSASWDGMVKHWDSLGREIRTLDFQQGRITCLAVSQDGSRACVGTDRGSIVIWDLQ